MIVFATFYLVTIFMCTEWIIVDALFRKLVVVTLGAFGISEAGRAFGK